MRAGSIPACTGEPSVRAAWPRSRRVYPRVYGGTETNQALPLPFGGLSPRVRGNLEHVGRGDLVVGSIPACTGEPSKRWAARANEGLSPRVRGNRKREADHPGHPGLSPRVRGNLERVTGAYGCARSIPACTGEPTKYASTIARNAVYPRVYGGTLKGMLTGSPKAVYPRVYGGTQTPHRSASASRGLSPRVRGNPPETRGRGSRSIPACTGEPESKSY